jgi:hypothetical protein
MCAWRALHVLLLLLNAILHRYTNDNVGVSVPAVVENPVGSLRRQLYMTDYAALLVTVHLCMYPGPSLGGPGCLFPKKPTDLW